jgi:translocation and assembly module TamB
MQSALLAQAAGALLSSGKSASLQDDLKKRFGIDTFNVDSQGGDFRNSIVSVGKYLTPDLYVSIGRSIFTGDNQFTVTYSLSKNWEVQSKTGNESGATLLLVKVR